LTTPVDVGIEKISSEFKGSRATSKSCAVVIGGGKFANGAQTGAFRYLFNDSFDHLISKGSHDYERTSSAVCSTSS
jgi:uridylate kinase